ncbi:hypothetical protein SCHPADRAFT_945877 [Schizopora paradoxa]|uniref:Uncharacterized protein n=1 Tax=Schizopora paradoxa TaxID=27342 RepID=A0A0H2RB02_9AGAM|nr:hypothetical protein SCHPADRAFT_945877 [Schizopora paradoxa]
MSTSSTNSTLPVVCARRGPRQRRAHSRTHSSTSRRRQASFTKCQQRRQQQRTLLTDHFFIFPPEPTPIQPISPIIPSKFSPSSALPPPPPLGPLASLTSFLHTLLALPIIAPTLLSRRARRTNHPYLRTRDDVLGSQCRTPDGGQDKTDAGRDPVWASGRVGGRGGEGGELVCEERSAGASPPPSHQTHQMIMLTPYGVLLISYTSYYEYTAYLYPVYASQFQLFVQNQPITPAVPPKPTARPERRFSDSSRRSQRSQPSLRRSASRRARSHSHSHASNEREGSIVPIPASELPRT